MPGEEQLYTRLTAEDLNPRTSQTELVNWIKHELVPAVNKMGDKLSVKDAKTLTVPPRSPVEKTMDTKNRPDAKWMKDHFHEIEKMVLQDIEKYTKQTKR
jgi:hypothetical protein